MRIKDKIEEIEKYLSELGAFMPDDFREYQRDAKTKAACERYFERIIEAAVDLAFLIIKDDRFKTPEDDKEAFDILAKEEIMTAELAERLKDAKGMRNIIAHQYGVVDDEIVFKAITEELVRDVKDFLDHVNTHIKQGNK
jgi:uncharacterized protein YutE (UPF0331/DUF86 family)